MTTQLQLNAETSVGGFIVVGLQNASGGAWLAGYALDQAVPFIGNSVRAPATWAAEVAPGPWESGNSDVSPLADQAIVAVVAMQRASLYSWRFACV